MSFAVTDEDLDTLGQTIVAGAAGAFGGYEVAFNELTLTAPMPRIVEALSFLRDHADLKFRQLIAVSGRRRTA